MRIGKITTIAIVLILLVGLPLSSYLYLRKGMNFRLDAIEALDVKSHLPAGEKNPELSGVRILYFPEAAEATLVDSVKEHFSNHTMLFFDAVDEGEAALNDSLRVAHEMCKVDGQYNDFIYLVNRKDAIVNCYDPNDLLAVKKLINHIAFLLPPDPEKDFDFRRSKEM